MVISSLFNFSFKTEIILDNEFLSFKEIISVLDILKKKSRSKGITFKIVPKNTHFLIGSNSNNDRGEIIQID
jgi:hypothetical protein